MCLACCQANTSAEMITPVTTAMARSVSTVITVTATTTIASLRGTLRIALRLPHAKVFCETTNIRPIRAAKRDHLDPLRSEQDERQQKQRSGNAGQALGRAVVHVDHALPDHGAAAHAAEEAGDDIGRPCATHSRLGMPRVSVISSIRFRVSRDSIRPMAARIRL